MKLHKLFVVEDSAIHDWLMVSSGGTTLPPLPSAKDIVSTATNAMRMSELVIYAFFVSLLIAAVVCVNRK
jgi:hypothetical protein